LHENCIVAWRDEKKLTVEFATLESYMAELMGLKGLGLMKKDEFALGEYDLLWLK